MMVKNKRLFQTRIFQNAKLLLIHFAWRFKIMNYDELIHLQEVPEQYNITMTLNLNFMVQRNY